ncbi:MAG: hypothetical protein JWP37_781 [Mucilaginibacter sp.]|nr:hypothetical protein [Mucilaginibacter sp.]
MDLNTHVESVIDQMTCSVHKKRPLLVTVNDRIQISSCCPDFKIICLKKMIQLLTEYKEQELSIAWKRQM